MVCVDGISRPLSPTEPLPPGDSSLTVGPACPRSHGHGWGAGSLGLAGSTATASREPRRPAHRGPAEDDVSPNRFRVARPHPATRSQHTSRGAGLNRPAARLLRSPPPVLPPGSGPSATYSQPARCGCLTVSSISTIRYSKP
jgi:hypothetical protein